MSWGLALSIASTYLKGRSQASQIDKQNKAKLVQFEQNKALTSEMIGTLQVRTDRAEYEAVRSNIRNIMQINKSVHKAEGEAAVAAAHKGTGGGKRGALAVFRPAERIAGDMVTDANINLETEFQNITDYYNDTALRMIANLNNNAPILQEKPQTFDLLLSSAATGMQYYAGMSDAGKATFKDMFKGAEKAGVQNLVTDTPAGYAPEAFAELS